MRPSTSRPWVISAVSRPDARIRLYCFTHAGGPTSHFVRWSRQSPPWLHICPIRMPGRTGSQPGCATVEELVDALVTEAEWRPPFAFFGHSLGALLAFELAHALRLAGRPGPSGLIVSAHPAPAWPRGATPITDLDDDAFLAAIEQRHGWMPAELGDEPQLRALVLGYLRTEYRMAERYRHRHRAPLDVPITAYAAVGDRVPPDAVRGWSDETTAGFRSRWVPGGHFYLVDADRGDVVDALVADVGDVAGAVGGAGPAHPGGVG